MPSPLILAVAALALVETLVAAVWWLPYFEHGVVISREDEPLTTRVASEDSAPLRDGCSDQASGVVLHRAAGGTLLARVKLGLNSFPFARAEIRCDPLGNRLVLTYRLAWYPIAIGAILLLQPILTHRPVAPRVGIVAVVALFVYLEARQELKLLRAVGKRIALSHEGQRMNGRDDG